MVRKRSHARQVVLQALYQQDLCGADVDGELRDFINDNVHDEASRAFALELLKGAVSRKEFLDDEIRRVAENWQLARMACIDRNVLRLGAYELFFRPDVPAKVAINEAIELAKRFSTGESGHFVNGILDRIRETCRGE